jgi:LTXXQ motif family protein
VPQRATIPHNQPPAVVNRGIQQREVQRQQVRQERALQRQQAQPTAQAKPNLPTQTQMRSNAQAQPQSQLNTRQQQRAERTLRRSEDRELRRLPPSQRVQRREEIRNAREQRTLSRQQLVQPNAVQNQRNARRANRLNGTARVTQDAARQGRFAARFASRAAGLTGRDRFASVAAHHAWRRGLRAAFVPWYGPVFWPYAYSDIFDYAFWPYGYDDGYWAYAYDDFLDGVFWGEAGPPVDYAYAAPTGRLSTQRPSYAAVQELCRQPGSGVTAWPFADIERNVGLNAEQRELLNDVRKASQDAAAVFKASCPADNAFPLTPPGRLAAMTARLDATLQAVQTVRPAMERFYGSLNDEQKERFNQLGPKNTAANAEASIASQAAETCKQPKPGLANLPIEKIEDALNPTDAQEAKLNELQDATDKAVSIMQAACPDETPITPIGRLDAMEKRLQAMSDAGKMVKPALEDFYASLSSEQKARFNRIGRSLAETTGPSSN